PMYFFFQAEDGIRDFHVTGVQTCALPILDEAVAGWVKGDEHRLQQIINSLIHYSIRHQEAGEILLAARQGERDQVMFEILSGQNVLGYMEVPGMETSALPLTSSDNLNLTLVKQLVSLMKGEFYIQRASHGE